MKIVNLLKKLFISLYSSIRRFPISIGFSTATAILLIILSHNEMSFSSSLKDQITRISMVLALGIPISLCIKLFFDRSKDTSLASKTAIYLIGSSVLIFYYFFLINNFERVAISRYVGVSAAFYLIFLFMPYFYKRGGFELYVIKLSTRFFVTALYSLILFGGISAILFTIDKLLGVHIQSKIYLDIWIAVVGVFAPCFFLAGIPLQTQNFEDTDYSRLLKVLLLYIMMPLIVAYTVILYIYFAKVIITFSWPVGMVAHLVLWYGVINVIVFFLIAPLRSENNWVRVFIFWLSKLLVPLLIMMFVSIGIRVNAYGITENRYFVIVLGLWVLGIMIYSSLTKTRRNIIMPISLSIIIILSIFGPWSAYSISKFSQNARFESLLSKNNMLENNKIVKPKVTVSEEDKTEISRVLGYFSDYHKLADVKYLPTDFKIDNMENVFGFPNTNTGYRNQEIRYLSYNTNMADKPINIKGYEYLINIRSYDVKVSKLDNGVQVNYNNQSTELSILSDGKEIFKNKLSEIAKEIHKKYGTTGKNELSLDEASSTTENEKVKLKFIMQNISGEEDKSTGEIRINSIDFYVLISMK